MMNVNGKKYFDDVTFKKAVKLIRKGKLTLNEICKELHTSRSVLERSMDAYFHISADEGEPNWVKIYKAKLKITKQKGNTRIVYECQSCSYEQVAKMERCPKCGSYSIRKTEIRNKVSSGELKASKMIGRRKKIKRFLTI